jgi:hypothetical protein
LAGGEVSGVFGEEVLGHIHRENSLTAEEELNLLKQQAESVKSTLDSNKQKNFRNRKVNYPDLKMIFSVILGVTRACHSEGATVSG